MENARELVAQVDWLIDRQVDAIQGRLSLDDAVEYADRIRRVGELLEPLIRDQSKLN